MRQIADLKNKIIREAVNIDGCTTELAEINLELIIQNYKGLIKIKIAETK